MTAPKGNQFWKARSKHGRKMIFESPDKLWSCCEDYFEWVDSTPLFESKVFHSAGNVTKVPVQKMRAMTINGLCCYLNIGLQTWYDYKVREGFSDICERVESLIWCQKFEGAAANLLNPSIIAREIGLSDKIDANHSSNGIKVIELRTDFSGSDDLKGMSDDELRAFARSKDINDLSK